MKARQVMNKDSAAKAASQQAPASGWPTSKDEFNKARFEFQRRVHGDRRLRACDLRVAFFIVEGFNFDKGYSFPSQNKLRGWTGLSINVIARCIRRLEHLGIISVKTRGSPGRTAEYVLNLDAYPNVVSPQIHGGRTPKAVSPQIHGGIIPPNPRGVYPHEEMAPQSLPPRSERVGVVRLPGEAAASPRLAGREEVSAVLEKLWAAWDTPHVQGHDAARRVLTKVLARPDAPSTEPLVAAWRQYQAAAGSRARWLHKWLEAEGWREGRAAPPPREPKAKVVKGNGTAPAQPSAEWQEKETGDDATETIFVLKSMGCIGRVSAGYKDWRYVVSGGHVGFQFGNAPTLEEAKRVVSDIIASAPKANGGAQ
jgi:hypothetical protein